ncbi:sigma 54-interacting transcriptional regulator [uncultured Vibrio sp.]
MRLRVLQEQVYEPLGAIRPARIIAATHRDLHQMVVDG